MAEIYSFVHKSFVFCHQLEPDPPVVFALRGSGQVSNAKTTLTAAFDFVNLDSFEFQEYCCFKSKHYVYKHWYLQGAESCYNVSFS